MIKLDFRTRRIGNALVGLALTAVLAACGGGGGNSGSSVFDGGGAASSPSGGASTPVTATAADLVVVLSKSSLSNTGTDSLTVTVTSIDSNRASVGNVPVSFSVDSNAVVTAGGTVTGTDGTLTATVSEGSDTTVRAVNVTVTSGSVTRKVSFNVVQSVATSTPQAADLSLQLDLLSINNAGSTPVNATATAVDANRNALTGIPIQVSVDSNAIAVVSGTQTDNNGQVKASVTIGSDHSNRTITVTATSGTLIRKAAFKVTGALLQVTASPTVAPSSSNNVIFTLVDVNQNPMIGQAISVTASGLPSATSTTDSNGRYTYSYTAPSAAGALTISGTAGGTSATANVAVSSSTSTVPNAGTPVGATLQISPNVVAVNSGATANQSSLTMNFVDAANKVVPNVRVRFDVNDAAYIASNQYGTISQQKIYSDSSGNANTTFVPGSIASPTNGVTIRACWSTVEFVSATDCPHTVTSTLTVVSNPVSISIGTDNTIGTGSSTLTYVKKYVVLVVDAAGNPKPDVQVTPSIDLGGFAKGNWFWNGTIWTMNLMASCPTEDLNRNGVIDSTEDLNTNQQLDPRKSDVSITMVGSTKTDANGVAVLQIEYPKNVASWVQFKVSAAAGGVLSPPGYYPVGIPVALPSTQFTTGMNVDAYLSTYATLPVDASTLSSENSPPPFVTSPYGSNNDCKSKN